jgi:hypothetical protein
MIVGTIMIFQNSGTVPAVVVAVIIYVVMFAVVPSGKGETTSPQQ